MNYCRKNLFLFIVFFTFGIIIGRNFLYILSAPPYLYWGSPSPPGKTYLPLRHYLEKTLMAGFWSNITLPNPDVDTNFMFQFQRAQFALTPTLLDHYTPLKHQYIVTFVGDIPVAKVGQRINADLVLKLNDHIALFKNRAFKE